MFDNCDGECGAIVEHSAEVDPSDTISLLATRDTRLRHEPDHYPFLAGTIGKACRTYVFSLRDQDDLEFFGHGASIDTARFFRREFSGAHMLTGVLPTDKDIYIPVLKYDPDAYYLSEYYKKKREEEEVEMDPTGPFFWKFSRLLPPGVSLPVGDNRAESSSRYTVSSSPTPGLETSDVSVVPVEDADKALDQDEKLNQDANSTSSLLIEDVTILAGDDGDEYYYETRSYFSDEGGEDIDCDDDDGWVTADEGSDSDV